MFSVQCVQYIFIFENKHQGEYSQSKTNQYTIVTSNKIQFQGFCLFFFLIKQPQVPFKSLHRIPTESLDP